MLVGRRKLTATVEPIDINNIAINPMKKGDSYKYLGQNENLDYV